MKKIALGFVILFLALGLSAQETKSIPKDTPEADVKRIMKLMIYMIENGSADEVLYRYAEPNTISRFKKDGNLAEIAAQFKNGRYKRLLAALKKSVDWPSEITADKTMVTFLDPKKDKNMVFVKIEGIWYMKN